MRGLTLDWLQIVAVVGAVQGVLLAGALLAHRANATANRLLAALMVAFSVFLVGDVYYASGLIRVFPHFFGIPYLMPWIFGPLVYLYALAASDRGRGLRLRDALHLLPLLVVLAAGAPNFVASGAAKIALYERFRAGDVPATIAVLDPFKYVSGIAYSVATVLVLRRHRRQIEQSYANTERVNLRWLVWLTGAATAIWVLAVALKLGGTASPLRDQHLSLAMALLIYSIGYVGLRQPEIFRWERADGWQPAPQSARPGSTSMVADLGAADAAAPGESARESPSESTRVERASLTSDEGARLRDALLAVMAADAPWRDSALTLPMLAARLGTTPHKLSELLNAQLGQTFYDFVNGYRVRDVQRRIEAGEARTRKMLALAMDAGFASKSTFNDAFKKHTNLTPSGFRETVGA